MTTALATPKFDAATDTFVDYRNRSMVEYKPGDFVRVLPAYRGGKSRPEFVADGTEGLYLVKRLIAGSRDFKLVRVRDFNAPGLSSTHPIVESARTALPHLEYDLICHAGRMERA